MCARLDDTLTSAPRIIREYTSYLTHAQGKHIRARGLLACAISSDGIAEEAADIAAAVELLHLATLVHDDIIDDADLRRGFPSLHKQFGSRTAVICGDYLMCAALKLGANAASKHEDKRGKFTLTDYITPICLGELRQHINNRNLNLTVRQYLSIIRGKTAAIFKGSFCAGAMLSCDSDSEAKAYARLGHYVGMMFQLSDDCMDYTSTQYHAKKPVRSDFEQGVITLPLIHALAADSSLATAISSNELTTQSLYARVLELGGIQFAKAIASLYRAKALRLMEKLNPIEEKRGLLIKIIEKTCNIDE